VGVTGAGLSGGAQRGRGREVRVEGQVTLKGVCVSRVVHTTSRDKSQGADIAVTLMVLISARQLGWQIEDGH
jgi:hypothetical protein